MSCSQKYFALNPEISFSNDGRPEHTIPCISLFPMAIAKCVRLLSKEEKYLYFLIKPFFSPFFFLLIKFEATMLRRDRKIILKILCLELVYCCLGFFFLRGGGLILLFWYKFPKPNNEKIRERSPRSYNWTKISNACKSIISDRPEVPFQ